MKAFILAAPFVCWGVLAGTAASAAEPAAPARSAAPAASAPALDPRLDTSPTAPVAGGEPAVRHTVIDGETTHIDELRVRGQLKSVTVSPKGSLPAYEVLTGSGSRDLPEQGINRSSGTEGKRVWKLFRF